MESLMESIRLYIFLILSGLIPVCAMVSLALFVYREQERRANWKMKEHFEISDLMDEDEITLVCP